MSDIPTFNDICNYLAARRCRNAGQSIKRIAKSAKKPKAVVKRWLKETAHVSRSKHGD